MQAEARRRCERKGPKCRRNGAAQAPAEWHERKRPPVKLKAKRSAADHATASKANQPIGRSQSQCMGEQKGRSPGASSRNGGHAGTNRAQPRERGCLEAKKHAKGPRP